VKLFDDDWRFERFKIYDAKPPPSSSEYRSTNRLFGPGYSNSTMTSSVHHYQHHRKTQNADLVEHLIDDLQSVKAQLINRRSNRCLSPLHIKLNSTTDDIIDHNGHTVTTTSATAVLGQASPRSPFRRRNNWTTATPKDIFEFETKFPVSPVMTISPKLTTTAPDFARQNGHTPDWKSICVTPTVMVESPLVRMETFSQVQLVFWI